MVYDDMKLLLCLIFFSDRVWALFDSENKLSLKIKKKRKKPKKTQHTEESNVKTIKREKIVKYSWKICIELFI